MFSTPSLVVPGIPHMLYNQTNSNLAYFDATVKVG